MPSIFCHDQEPISAKSNVWEFVSEQCTTQVANNWRVSTLLLANSEKNSTEKDAVLRSLPVVDFYYFFHGFAALDWYRSNEFYCLPKQPKYNFVVNARGISGSRAYRLYLISQLHKRGLLDQSLYSVSVAEDGQDYSEIAKRCLPAHIASSISLPSSTSVSYDSEFSSTASARINDVMYSQVRFQIVAETVAMCNRQHLTEKVFQPIVTKTPFLLIAGQNATAYLTSYGFKDYSKWFKVNDTSESWVDRVDSAISAAEQFCSLSEAEKEHQLKEMAAVAEFNYNHFYGEFKQIILKELLENFKVAHAIAVDKTIERFKQAPHLP